MACERSFDALSDHAAGAPAAVELEAHLAACAGCRSELAALQQALATADEELSRLASAEPPPGLQARIRAAVASAPPGVASPARWVSLAVAAAATLVLGTLWVARSPSPDPRVAEQQVQPAEPPAGGAELAPERVGPLAPDRLRPGARERGAGRVPTSPQPRRRPDVQRAAEVLVASGEVEALRRLVALVHRERLAPAALGAVEQPASDLAELPTIDIPPLEIVPLEIVPLDAAESSGT